MSHEAEVWKPYDAEVGKIRETMVEVVQYFLREYGMSSTHEGRVNMLAFNELHTADTLRKHDDFVRRKEKWIRKNETDQQRRERVESDLFEQMVSIIFTKFASEQFIVFRSSKYDDLKNGIDTVIIDRESGDTMCSVDEVVSDFKSTVQKKREHVLRVNDIGVNLNYGFRKNENGIFVPAEYHANFPLCYLPFPRKLILPAVNQLSDRLFEVSDMDRTIFKYLLKYLCLSLKTVVTFLENENQKNSGEHHGVHGEKIARIDGKSLETAKNTLRIFSDLKERQTP